MSNTDYPEKLFKPKPRLKYLNCTTLSHNFLWKLVAPFYEPSHSSHFYYHNPRLMSLDMMQSREKLR